MVVFLMMSLIKDGVDTIYKIQEALQRLGYKVKSKAGHTYGDMKTYEFT